MPVRPESISALQPWLTSDTGAHPQIVIQFTNVKVERGLVGARNLTRIDIAYPLAAAARPLGADFVPIFNTEDRGLLFLRELPSHVAYAAYIPQPAYQLANGETGVRKFLVTDYDERGQPFTRDETAKVEDAIAAVQWYSDLDRENPEALHQALMLGLDDPNPQITRHAIRSLSHRGDSKTVRVFKERLQNATGDLRIRLILGLWILGEKDTAETLLEGIFREYGKDAWLAHWGIKPSMVEEGDPVGTLYGPDPSKFKGESAS
jgi:hypothetical protein